MQRLISIWKQQVNILYPLFWMRWTLLSLLMKWFYYYDEKNDYLVSKNGTKCNVNQIFYTYLTVDNVMNISVPINYILHTLIINYLLLLLQYILSICLSFRQSNSCSYKSLLCRRLHMVLRFEAHGFFSNIYTGHCCLISVCLCLIVLE